MTVTAKPSVSTACQSTGTPVIWLDGKWYDRSTATVSVYDHGLLYGDGVFEGIRVYGGKIFRLAEHLERLYDSAKAIWLTIPDVAGRDGRRHRGGGSPFRIKEAYIRHIVTRGVGDLGLDPRKCPKPTVIIIVDTIKLWPEQVYEAGLRVITAGTPIPQRESLSPRVKSLNYLAHILAKIEGIHGRRRRGVDAGQLGRGGRGVGAEHLRREERPHAHPAGVRRNPEGRHPRRRSWSWRATPVIRWKRRMLNRYDMYTADEAFFTGTASEIVAIRQLDGRIIGAGKAGPVTRDLRARFQALVRS